MPRSHRASSALAPTARTTVARHRSRPLSRRERRDAERAAHTARHRRRGRTLHSVTATVFAASLAVASAFPALTLPATAAPDRHTASTSALTQSLHYDGGETAAAPRDEYTAESTDDVIVKGSIEPGDEAELDHGQLSGQTWALPLAGRISDPFGPRPHRPVAGVSAFHKGADVSDTCGVPIVAATSGTVVTTGPDGTLGNWILIDHGEGIQTGYGHIAGGGTEVSEGDRVTAGEEIARVGSTGASTGCHLHFEVHIDGKAVDPVQFLARRGITLGG